MSDATLLDALLDQLAAPAHDLEARMPALVGELRAAAAAQAAEHDRLQAEVEQLLARRGDMLRRVVAVQDERCRRISRELHDDISQSLAAMALDLETLQAAGCITGEDALAHLDDLRARLIATLDEVGRIIADLRPLMLEDMGLASALRRYADLRLAPSGVRIHVTAPDPPVRLSPHLETTLYRIGQEAINNIARHAAAHTVWLRLARTGDQIELSMQDDGRGFDAAQTLRLPGERLGVGLFSMRERAALAGGVCEIRSAPGEGATITARIPASPGASESPDA
jgi:two-component system sensor histidine kinase UhpB